MNSFDDHEPPLQDIPVENLAEGLLCLVKSLLAARGIKSAAQGGDLHAEMQTHVTWYQNLMHELTPHQQETLALAVCGWHGKDIARKLEVSLETVDAHCVAIKVELEAIMSTQETHQGTHRGAQKT